MDAGLVTAIIGVAGTLIGTILGFGLNSIQANQAKKQQIRAARSMISLELDRNLSLLRDYYEVTQSAILGETRELEFPPPVWSHKMWESQMSLLPLALTVEELKQSHHHHTELDILTEIQAEVYRREPKRKEESRKLKMQRAWDNMDQQVDAALVRLTVDQLRKRLRQIAGDVLRLGNPLHSEANPLSFDRLLAGTKDRNLESSSTTISPPSEEESIPTKVPTKESALG